MAQVRGGQGGEDERGGNIAVLEAVNDDGAGLGGLDEAEGVLAELGPGDGGHRHCGHLAGQASWLASLFV